jgi:hypothetical protein
MLPMSQVTAVTQYIAKVGRYNQLGANGLKDKRHQHPGTQPLISQVQQAQMKQTLQTPPADGGLWNRRKVAEGLSNLLDRSVRVQRSWDYLRSLEFRLRIPRPEPDYRGYRSPRSLEKKRRARAKRIKQQHPLAVVEVWGMDEHRLGLKPIIRRVWVGYGEQPIANVNWRYQWLWLYGFVHPSTGETYFWILPRVNTELFNQVLVDFAA